VAKSKTINIKGTVELDRKLRALGASADRIGKKAIKDETHETAEDLRKDAPVDTGELKRGIQEETLNKGLTGRVALTAAHTTFVINGTSDTPANDFVTGNITKTRRRYPKRVARLVEEELRRLSQ
jgi:HK97 gp10 family phage protein